MSFDDVFKELRIEHGLKQKSNSIGTVYGMCMTKLCANYHKIGYYTGGFCKKCSTRYQEDNKKPVLKGINIRGTILAIPNPEIRWTIKKWVHDLSDKFTDTERRLFYGDPVRFEQSFEREAMIERMDKIEWDDQNE